MPEKPHNPQPRWYEILFISACALLLYATLFGVDTLYPTQTAWLLQGDPAQHYLGWQFFRTEPWQWPPGRIAGWGYPQGAAIGLSDSIPLLALPLKTLSPLLPAQFQYFGAWIAACYLLTGYYGLRLLSCYTKDSALRTIGAGFFLVSPPILLRGYGHEALMAHWLLLAAFDLYLRGWSAPKWLLLTTVAALCHPYLLLLNLGLLAAALYSAHSHTCAGAVPLKTLAGQGAAIAATAALALWVAGYFSGSGALAAQGYGYFSMNVLSLIDPLLGWSRFIPQQPIHANYQTLGNFGQYEGFLYLGAGMIALVFIAVPAVFVGGRVKNSPQLVPTGNRKHHPPIWPLALAATIYWLLALSNTVLIADQHLFTVPLPATAVQLLSIFRASGRLGWPAFYLISLLTLATLITRMPRTAARLLLGTALLLQCADQSHKYLEFRGIIRLRTQWQTPLASPQWQTWASKANTLVMLPDASPDNAYIPLAQLAASHTLRTNAAHLARTAGAPAAWSTAIQAELRAGQTRPGWLYIFTPGAPQPELHPSLQSRFLTLDGYRVLPP